MPYGLSIYKWLNSNLRERAKNNSGNLRVNGSIARFRANFLPTFAASMEKPSRMSSWTKIFEKDEGKWLQISLHLENNFVPFLLLFKQYMLDEEDLDEVSKNYRSDQHHTSPSDSWISFNKRERHFKKLHLRQINSSRNRLSANKVLSLSVKW